NGVHLNEHGNMLVASLIDRALFGEREKPIDAKAIEKIRQAVLDKNFYWFHRYRVVDGYNVYGGRAFERYQEQQSHYEDQQPALEILDVMTANRDKRIWAVARAAVAGAGDPAPTKIDDSNTPLLIPVK